MNKKNESWSATAIQMGGTNSGASQTFSNSTPTTTINYASWESSINESNAGITQINWASAIPIYDLVADPTKKSEIRAAVQRRMEKDPIKIVEVAPLYRLHNSYCNNTHFVISLDEGQELIDNHGYYWDNGDSRFPQHYVQGYVFKYQEPGTVPLYRVFDGKVANSFWTTSYSELKYYMSTYGYDTYFYGPNQPLVLGYVYPRDTYKGYPYVSLRRLYHRSGNSWMTTSGIEEQKYISTFGYYKDNGRESTHIQGYILKRDI